MTSRELVSRTIRFEGGGRLAYDLPAEYGTDFWEVNMNPSPDDRPRGRGMSTDEWGAVWRNIGVTNLGEVTDFPLKDWKDLDKLNVPDISEARRWEALAGAREAAEDKFLIGSGISLYERVHFIRGLENTWVDIFEAREELCRLIDMLVEMNLYAIERYAEADADALMFCDDWGLQNRLMISPDSWRRIWRPRYERVYRAAHDHGFFTILHCCGYIVEILDDLIEVGLDVIQMDQQENMGLELLGERFGGRITFFSPVDIQTVMARGAPDEIRAYCGKMLRLLGRPGGGFIPTWYKDPAGAGHSAEAVETMCREFVRLSHRA